MPKTRKHRDLVESKYFHGVTHLWVPPNKAPVPERYHVACGYLADWAVSLPGCRAEDWADNDKTGYLVIRHYIVLACESWRTFDWEKASNDNRALREARRASTSLLTATSRFREAMGSFCVNRALGGRGHETAKTLHPDQRVALKEALDTDAVKDAVYAYEQSLERLANLPIQFGPLHYQGVPREVRQETALAIVLADIITECRRDSGGCRRGKHPLRVPKISENTPWKAIAEFLKADSEALRCRLDSETLKVKAESHLPSVHQVQLFR